MKAHPAKPENIGRFARFVLAVALYLASALLGLFGAFVLAKIFAAVLAGV